MSKKNKVKSSKLQIQLYSTGQKMYLQPTIVSVVTVNFMYYFQTGGTFQGVSYLENLDMCYICTSVFTIYSVKKWYMDTFILCVTY